MHLEHFGNLGTWWEYIEKKGEEKQKLIVPSPHSKRKKKIGSIYCLLFTILRPFGTKESIRQKVDHEG
jgi:hypothetical protein